MDEEAIKELKKLVKSEEEINLKFPEHDFFATALKIGITIEDLKELTYVDILKIFISFLQKDKDKTTNGVRKATQEEINQLVARM
uniref:Uncharacterized protein n=1 Tax=Myoviridae sp. ct8mY9 TaxID=2827664 RepID=A0A8S5SF16_9CAUD|nr:MAG TPA: hypothetical protein [Myoviridae sp. ct8mY9]DAP55130.1 MAG TPA: hypothetical protein [Caudoviricetes sp.]